MAMMHDEDHAEVLRWRAAAFRRALALLDEGEKDRERLDALQALTETDDLVLWVRENRWCVEVVDAAQKHRGASLRAAIDQARGA